MSTSQIIFDEANTKRWASKTTTIDADGATTKTQIVFDDGRIVTRTFEDGILRSKHVEDPEDVKGFATKQFTYGADGALESRTVERDDGTLSIRSYGPTQSVELLTDPDDARPWDSRTILRDADENVLSRGTVLDNGVVTTKSINSATGESLITRVDADDAKAWSTIEVRTNSEGEVVYRLTNFDDGSFRLFDDTAAGPVAQDDTIRLEQQLDGLFDIDFPALLSNDSPDVAIVGFSDVTGGSILFSGGSTQPIFIPDASFTGVGSFNYTISDGMGGTATATVTYTINGPPTPNDDRLRIETGADTFVFNAIDLVNNDNDPDRDPLAVNDVRPEFGASVGILTFEPNTGELIFEVGENFNGIAELIYTVTDTSGNSAEARVTLEENLAPTALSDTLQLGDNFGGERSLFTASLLDNDSDPENDRLEIVGFSNIVGGTIIEDPDSFSFVFVEGSDFTGSGSFEYTITDGLGGFATATAEYTSRPDPAQANPDFVTATGTTTIINVLANDDIPGGSDPRIVSVTQPNFGSVTINRNGTDDPSDDTLTYTSFFIGSPLTSNDRFDYTIRDVLGNLDTATVVVDISGDFLLF